MQILFLKICLLFGGFAALSNIYSIHITTIDGQVKSIQDFRGKKIMVVVLPVTQNAQDSRFLRSLDSLSRSFQNLAVIAVPPFEDGFSLNNSTELRNFYESLLGNEITITKGMYTRKGADQNQHELFSWLTHKEKNVHFDIDVSGVGQIFFINEQGDLYRVIGSGVRLSTRIMQRMLQY